MTVRYKFVCPKCASDQVVVDACATWDQISQKWILSTAHDTMICQACEYENEHSFNKVPVPPLTPMESSLERWRRRVDELTATDEDFATEAEINTARSEHCSDEEISIDQDALASRGEDGVWVQAWVLVKKS